MVRALIETGGFAEKFPPKKIFRLSLENGNKERALRV
jgi:hypothetical protein